VKSYIDLIILIHPPPLLVLFPIENENKVSISALIIVPNHELKGLKSEIATIYYGNKIEMKY